MLRFGTDGVRGDAETALTSAYVVALGEAVATVLGTELPFLIGMDTRISGPRIAADLAHGLSSAGGRAESLGVLPTPGIAFESQMRGLPAAVISASHNPWSDNGIKFFAPGGLKIDDGAQLEIERRLEASVGDVATALHQDVTATLLTTSTHDTAVTRYRDHLVASLEGRRLDGLRVVIDAANGAASAVVFETFAVLGASVTVLHCTPDGTNINRDCGSTHMGSLQREVVAQGADVGFALDGDADRCLGVDEFGNVIDGDEIMIALAIDMKQRGVLASDSLVVTVLSNLGLRLAARAAQIHVVETAVGDRAVMAAMESGGFVLGGEQSGHIIVRERATTGDGMLTALLFSDLLVRNGLLASQAKESMTALPQVMVNVRMAAMPDLDAADELWTAVAQEETALGATGRVLVRASGTEPLVRVMVEAPSESVATDCAERLAAVVRGIRA